MRTVWLAWMWCSTSLKWDVCALSLGGALANLFTAATLLPKSDKDLTSSRFRSLITFGEPRLGDYLYVHHVSEAFDAGSGRRYGPAMCMSLLSVVFPYVCQIADAEDLAPMLNQVYQTYNC